MPKFEWDEAKDRSNRRKHGIPFSRAVEIFSNPFIFIPDVRKDYDEKRFNAVGVSQHYIMNVTFTWRDDLIRIISARPANKKERRMLMDKVQASHQEG